MEETKKILLLGAGGHCLSVLDSLLSSYHYETIGIIVKEKTEAEQLGEGGGNPFIMGFPIVGCDDDLERLYLEGYSDAFITVGSIGDVALRRKLYQSAKKIGFYFPNIIDKSSVVSSHAVLTQGIYIGKKAVVNTYAKIGICAIINTASVVEHECVLQDFVHVAPGSILSGKVQVAEATHIGAGSTVKQGIHIGSGSMIGMGSVVLQDIGDNLTAYGNPCKEVKHE